MTAVAVPTNTTRFMTRDPTGPSDYVVLAVAFLCTTYYLVMILGLFIKRNAPPVKVKDAPLCIIAAISACFITLSAVIEYEVVVFPPDSWMVHTCGWMSPIFTSGLGVLTFLNCLCSRMIRLFLCMRLRKRSRGSPLMNNRAFLFSILEIPVVILVSASLIAQSDYYSAYAGGCLQPFWYNITKAILLCAGTITIFVLAIFLRNLPRGLNEYRETLIGATVTAAAVVLLAFLTNVSQIDLLHYWWGRFICCLMMISVGFVYLVLFISKPIVLCFLKGRRYEDKWLTSYRNEAQRDIARRSARRIASQRMMRVRDAIKLEDEWQLTTNNAMSERLLDAVDRDDDDQNDVSDANAPNDVQLEEYDDSFEDYEFEIEYYDDEYYTNAAYVDSTTIHSVPLLDIHKKMDD